MVEWKNDIVNHYLYKLKSVYLKSKNLKSIRF